MRILAAAAGSRLKPAASASAAGGTGGKSSVGGGGQFRFARPVTLLLQRLLLVCLAGLAFVARADDARPETPARNQALSHHGAIGVGSWNTAVEYQDIVVTSSNGTVLYRSDFPNQGTNGWRVFKGIWNARDGMLGQTGIMTDCRITTGDTNWTDYTLTLRARKTRGAEGFRLLFHWVDDRNFTLFNFGYWDRAACVEQVVGGVGTILGGQVPRKIETNVWYDLRVVVQGPRIECYVNQRLLEALTFSDGNLAAEKPIRTPAAQAAPHGAIGLGSWNTSVEYKDVVVSSNNLVLYRSDFSDQSTNGWTFFDGSWSAQDGVLAQTALQKDCRATLGDTNWANYSITLRARKIAGTEGFLVLFNWLDNQNFAWFNVGRWGVNACLEQYVDGANSIRQ
jgi:hypothetical protein